MKTHADPAASVAKIAAQPSVAGSKSNFGEFGQAFAIRNAIMKFVVSAYTGNMRDKKLTEEAINEHGVTGRRLSMRKYVLNSDELNNVISKIQAARNYFNSKSLPWRDEGVRIIPATSVIDLKSEMEEKIRGIMEAIDKLIDSLPNLIEEDKKKLGNTFNESDYPTAESLRSKFAARVEIWPVSVDFRVNGIEESGQKIIQKEIEDRIAETLKETKFYQLEQLTNAILHLSNRLSDKEKNFKSSSLDNILDASADIKNLSLDDDPIMQNLSDSIKNDFNKLNVDSLRENVIVREEAVKMMEAKLKEIKEVMLGFM